MRILVALLALFALGAAKPVDWTKTVSRTPVGSYVIGNPAAKVRLVAEPPSILLSHDAVKVKPLRGALRATLTAPTATTPPTNAPTTTYLTAVTNRRSRQTSG